MMFFADCDKDFVLRVCKLLHSSYVLHPALGFYELSACDEQENCLTFDRN